MEADGFHASLPSDGKHLRQFRSALRSWLEVTAVATDEQDAIILAAHEAAANAVEHASPDTLVDVHAARNADRVTVVVKNEGGWREYVERGRGRGLRLMSALTSDMDIAKLDGHIVVRLDVDLARP